MRHYLRAIALLSVFTAVLTFQNCAKTPFEVKNLSSNNPLANGTSQTETTVTANDSSGSSDPFSETISVNAQNANSLLTNKCSSCHNSNYSSGGVGDITSANNLIQKGLIIPGQASISEIYIRAAGGTMPPPPKTVLTSSELKILQDWINVDLYKPSTGGDSTAPAINFANQIKPILENRCVSCHSPGRIAAKILFDTSDHVAKWANGISYQVSNKLMPPFDLDSKNCNNPPILDDARLTENEINLLTSWVKNNVQDGNLKYESEKGISLIVPAKPTLTVDGTNVVSASMNLPYSPVGQPATGKPDQYRCFAINSVTNVDKYITGFEVVPGAPQVVHHVILYAIADGPNVATQSGYLDEADTGSGYDCIGSSSPSPTKHIDDYPVVIWAPGTGVQLLPLGTGIRIPANRKLILQVHYNIANGTAADKTKVLLKVSDQVQQQGLIFGVAATAPSLAPGNPAVTIHGEGTVPSEYSKIYGVFPHMHKLGKSIRLDNSTATTPATQCLGEVSNWRFQWQLDYYYNTPLDLDANPALRKLRVSCTYDTTQSSSNTYFGEGSNDEMCIGFYFATKPANSSIPAVNTPFSLSNNVSVSSINNNVTLTTTLNFASVDISSTKQVFIAAALPTATAGIIDYYMLNSLNQWVSVGQNLGAANWISYRTSSGKSYEILSILNNADLSTIPVKSVIFVGYGNGSDAASAKQDLLNRSTYGQAYEKK